MNKDRLLTLADRLQGRGKFLKLGPVPYEKFNIGFWSEASTKYMARIENSLEDEHVVYTKKEKKLYKKILKKLRAVTRQGHAYKFTGEFTDHYKSFHLVKQRECRTAACACGWATTIKEFNKAGLVLAVNASVFDTEEEANSATLYYQGETDLDAARLFFDIGGLDSDYLFSPGHYTDVQKVSPDFVAERIRAFVERGSSE